MILVRCGGVAILLYAAESDHAMKGVVLFGNETQRNVKHYVAVKGKHVSACMEDAAFQDTT